MWRLSAIVEGSVGEPGSAAYGNTAEITDAEVIHYNKVCDSKCNGVEKCIYKD